MKQSGFTQQGAEVLALQAVEFLAHDEDRVAKFLAASGLTPDSFMQNVTDPVMLAGVIDYILADEALLVEFAEFAGIEPEAPAMARFALPGAAQAW